MSNTEKLIKRMGLDENQKKILSDISDDIGEEKVTELVNSIVVTTPWTGKEIHLGGMDEEEINLLSDVAMNDFRREFEIRLFRELFGERRKLTPTTKVWLDELISWTGCESKALNVLEMALGCGFSLKSYELYICNSWEV